MGVPASRWDPPAAGERVRSLANGSVPENRWFVAIPANRRQNPRIRLVSVLTTRQKSSCENIRCEVVFRDHAPREPHPTVDGRAAERRTSRGVRPCGLGKRAVRRRQRRRCSIRGMDLVHRDGLEGGHIDSAFVDDGLHPLRGASDTAPGMVGILRVAVPGRSLSPGGA